MGELAKELRIDADAFATEFNADLNPSRKASLFGALRLIDNMFCKNGKEVNLGITNCQLICKCCDCYFLGYACPCACTLGGGDDKEHEAAEPVVEEDPQEEVTEEEELEKQY
eukprot:10716115-Ditylum_brightwellii.AAC.1